MDTDANMDGNAGAVRPEPPKAFARTYELSPLAGRSRTFRGRATVGVAADGTKVLRSYGTDVLMALPDGRAVRLWNGWSAQTGRHISAFLGRKVGKGEFLAMPAAEGVPGGEPAMPGKGGRAR